MLNWNAPLRDSFTGERVFVWGVHRSRLHGSVVIVQDVRGRKLPFSYGGVGVGHTRTVENMDPAFVARTRLASLISARARQQIEEIELAEMLTMENIDGWGTF